MGRFKPPRYNIFKRRREKARAKRRPGARSSIIIRSPSAIPDVTKVKLKYSSYFSGTTTTTALQQTVSGNSIFDPDVSGVGHEVLGHDQWSAFYNKYCVLSSSIKLMCQVGAGAAMVTCRPQSVTTGVATIALEMEKPRVKYVLPTVYQTKMLKHYQSTKSQFGKKNILDEQDFGANMSGNPANRWYWLIHSQAPDETTTSTVVIHYEVIYYVQLYDRKLLAQSS